MVQNVYIVVDSERVLQAPMIRPDSVKICRQSNGIMSTPRRCHEAAGAVCQRLVHEGLRCKDVRVLCCDCMTFLSWCGTPVCSVPSGRSIPTPMNTAPVHCLVNRRVRATVCAVAQGKADCRGANEAGSWLEDGCRTWRECLHLHTSNGLDPGGYSCCAPGTASRLTGKGGPAGMGLEGERGQLGISRVVAEVAPFGGWEAMSGVYKSVGGGQKQLAGLTTTSGHQRRSTRACRYFRLNTLRHGAPPPAFKCKPACRGGWSLQIAPISMRH